MQNDFQFSTGLIAEMDRLKLTVADLAIKTFKPRQTVSYWTKGKGSPSLDTFRRMVADIGFNPYRLLGLKKAALMHEDRVVYRLFHKRLKKYVAWPHGRQRINPGGPALPRTPDLMTMLRIENIAWGGTDDATVLEMHSIRESDGTVAHIRHLEPYAAQQSKNKRIWNRRKTEQRRQARSEISATATPGGTEASQTIRRSTT